MIMSHRVVSTAAPVNFLPSHFRNTFSPKILTACSSWVCPSCVPAVWVTLRWQLVCPLCTSSKTLQLCNASTSYIAVYTYQSKRACEKFCVIFRLLHIHVLMLIDFSVEEPAEWRLKILQTVVHCKETQNELPILFLAKAGCAVWQQAHVCVCQLVQ